MDAGVAHDTDDLADPPLARLLELLFLELLLLLWRQLLLPQLLLLLRLPPLPRPLGLRVALRERHPRQRRLGEISDRTNFVELTLTHGALPGKFYRPLRNVGVTCSPRSLDTPLYTASSKSSRHPPRWCRTSATPASAATLAFDPPQPIKNTHVTAFRGFTMAAQVPHSPSKVGWLVPSFPHFLGGCRSADN